MGRAWIEGEAQLPRTDGRTKLKVLAVGDPAEWEQQGNLLPEIGGIVFVSYDEVTEALILDRAPAMVFSPVLARRFDCIELAMRLQSMGYGGRYRAVAKSLPKPSVIESEVAQLCPDLDFAIIAGN